MNITLKKFQEHKGLSQESSCFTADIALDGKVIGSVENRGNGGCNFYHWTDKDAGERLTEYAIEKTKDTFEPLDHLLNDIIYEMDVDKKYRKLCKTGVLFRLPGDKLGIWRNVIQNKSKKVVYTQRIKDWVLTTYPKAEILNDKYGVLIP